MNPEIIEIIKRLNEMIDAIEEAKKYEDVIDASFPKGHWAHQTAIRQIYKGI